MSSQLVTADSKSGGPVQSECRADFTKRESRDRRLELSRCWARVNRQRVVTLVRDVE